MTHILNPFSIDIDPMSKLLLVNFEKDPDSVYIGFEPQVFDDTIHGKGHLVIGWRIDGKVDVYHEPSLKLNPKGYDIVGKGLANMVESNMQKAFFEVKNEGVQAHYIFNDINGREVQIKIFERNPKKRKPFGLLAPMGDAAENPSALPLVLLYDFYFVRKKHTDIEVTIDNVRHEIDMLPLPLDMTKMYFTRYSPKPLIARVNPSFNGVVNSIEVATGATTLSTADYEFGIVWENEKAFIQRISRKNDVHPVNITFDNPFPNILTLENDTAISGRFTIEAHVSTGQIIGEYKLEKANKNIQLTMIPTKGWKPRPSKLSLRFLYAVASIFKKWPSTYLWTANIRYEKEDNYTMASDWKRLK
ncbi:MAG: hypothetical protein EA412_12760 [Chitinophagaceae bacterium]|nr:MAG: hypothetical protein EA412_12760 [Chitinophagaceae bacterium]